MNYNNWTRHENEGALDEYLEKLGLTQALSSFLFTPDMHDQYHNLFVNSCENLKASIEEMPESVRDILLERMGGYEEAETFFINRSIENFKDYLATLMGANEYALGDASGIVQCYKTALESHDEHLEGVAMELAGDLLDDLIESYKKTWLSVLRDVDDQEGKKAILKAALGDDIPNLDHCVVVEVDMTHMHDDDEGDGEE